MFCVHVCVDDVIEKKKLLILGNISFQKGNKLQKLFVKIVAMCNFIKDFTSRISAKRFFTFKNKLANFWDLYTKCKRGAATYFGKNQMFLKSKFEYLHISNFTDENW